VLTTAVVTMVLTPFLSKAAVPLYSLWRRYVPRDPLSTFNLPNEGLHDHVIVAGYGRVGHAATSVMRRVGLECVVVELDQRIVERCKSEGFPVIYGDATSDVVLDAAGVHSARLLLNTVPDTIGSYLVSSRVRQLNPSLHIVARANDREQLRELKHLGVHEIVQPELEAGLEMVRQVLVHFRVAPTDIQRFSDSVHQELYAPISGEDGDAHDQRSARLLKQIRQVNRTLEIEWVSLGEASEMVGVSLGDARIRTRTGASVVAVVREGEIATNPGADYVFAAGDLLAVLGTHDQCIALEQLIGHTEPLDPVETQPFREAAASHTS
jgi:CPA2 family monovalent cation:H+ antiporter-2